MSYYKHPLDDIDVGDYVVLEVTGEDEGDEPYVYQVSGTVRKHDGVKAVGRNGIGEGKIIEHRPRPLPTAFASHIRYSNGVELVKTLGENWRSNDGRNFLDREVKPGWILVRDAGVRP
jgi:hypothetical protein